MVVSTMGKVAKLSNEMHTMGVSFLHFSPSIKAPLITNQRFWSWGNDSVQFSYKCSGNFVFKVTV